MNNILYEAKQSYGINPIFVCFCITCVLAIFCLVISFKKSKESILSRFFIIALIVFLIFIIGCAIYTVIDGRNKVYDEYKKGKYLTVEGEIVNYDTSVDLEGNTKFDLFEVSGLVFHVPGYTTQWGYPITQSEGSPLKNGVKVKIRYVPYKLENVIMKLEIVEDTGDTG